MCMCVNCWEKRERLLMDARIDWDQWRPRLDKQCTSTLSSTIRPYWLLIALHCCCCSCSCHIAWCTFSSDTFTGFFIFVISLQAALCVLLNKWILKFFSVSLESAYFALLCRFGNVKLVVRFFLIFSFMFHFVYLHNSSFKEESLSYKLHLANKCCMFFLYLKNTFCKLIYLNI